MFVCMDVNKDGEDDDCDDMNDYDIVYIFDNDKITSFQKMLWQKFGLKVDPMIVGLL